jgi:hypothetical protein
MAELKNMTLQTLRDLARKALGPGHSKLKTKAELIEALQAAERKVAGAAEKAASKIKQVTGRAARATAKVVDSVRGKESAAAGAKAPRVKAERTKAEKREKPRAGRPGARAAKGGAGELAPSKSAARKSSPPPTMGREPDPEGYMVARVAGEAIARGAPHPLTEGALEGMPRHSHERALPPPAFDEHLGELARSYQDDALIALPRDPRTLFLYWDHAQDTLRQAWEGLDGAKPQMWVFAREPDGGWTRVRVLDFALESRSYYIHELEPGRIYRAEIHLVDRQGRERLVPRTSNEMMLPPVGPSPVVDDRFMRILWSEPLQRLLRSSRAGGPFPEDVRQQLARLSDWSRFAGRVWGGSAGGMGGRPFSPTSAPSSPSSPTAPWGWSDGEDH